MKRWLAVLGTLYCLVLTHNFAVAGTSAVSCAQFKARLKSVGSSFGIAVQAPIYEVSSLSATDPYEQWYIVNYKDHEATLGCLKSGSFENLQIWGPFNGTGTEEDFFTNSVSINLVSAAIFAYTGWPAAKVDDARTKLMEGALTQMRRAKAKGEQSKGERIALPNGYAHIDSGTGGFSLLLETTNSTK